MYHTHQIPLPEALPRACGLTISTALSGTLRVEGQGRRGVGVRAQQQAGELDARMGGTPARNKHTHRHIRAADELGRSTEGAVRCASG